MGIGGLSHTDVSHNGFNLCLIEGSGEKRRQNFSSQSSKTYELFNIYEPDLSSQTFKDYELFNAYESSYIYEPIRVTESDSSSLSPRFEHYNPLLDYNGQITPENLLMSKSTPDTTRQKQPWNRQQKRAYHRCMSLLRFWMANGYQILWLCLTSSPSSNPISLNDNFTILKKRVERRYGYANIEHLLIRTNEGYGVYHGFLAYKPAKGMRCKSFYVPYGWLSRNWLELHHAHQVWVKRVKKSERSRKNVSRYCVSQYCADQNLFQRLSWSWKRGLGGALVRTWLSLKHFYAGKGNMADVIKVWNRVLSGEKVVLRVPGMSLGHAVHPPPNLHFDKKWVLLPRIQQILSINKI